MDISAVLLSNFPDAQWVLDGDTYEGLTWIGPGAKPSEAELEAAWPQVAAAIAASEAARVAARQSAIDKFKALGLTDAEVAALLGA